MLPNSYRISRVQKTLRWFEQDIPLLNMRVKDLSAERQQSARQFAAALIDQTRAELQRLLKEQPEAELNGEDLPYVPADWAGSRSPTDVGGDAGEETAGSSAPPSRSLRLRSE
jgi:hypothetical protein